MFNHLQVLFYSRFISINYFVLEECMLILSLWISSMFKLWSGLAAAYKLKSNGIRVTLFEAEERPGGKIKSTYEDGFIWDEGANTMVTSLTHVF